MTLVDRKLADLLRVEFDAQPYLSTIVNHSGQSFSAAEWLPDAGSSIKFVQSPSASLIANPWPAGPGVPATALRGTTNGSTTFVRAPEFEVTAGNVLALSIDITCTSSLAAGEVASARIGWNLTNSDGTSTLTSGYYDLNTTSTAQTVTRTVTVPAGAVRARPVVLVHRRSGGSVVAGASATWYAARARSIQAPTTALATANAGFREADWTNVLGSTVSARISRGGAMRGVLDEIETGTCTTLIKDAELDPGKGALLERGRAFRVTAEDAQGVRSPLFTGRISQADVDYGDVVRSRRVGGSPARPEQVTRTNYVANPQPATLAGWSAEQLVTAPWSSARKAAQGDVQVRSSPVTSAGRNTLEWSCRVACDVPTRVGLQDSGGQMLPGWVLVQPTGAAGVAVSGRQDVGAQQVALIAREAPAIERDSEQRFARTSWWPQVDNEGAPVIPVTPRPGVAQGADGTYYVTEEVQ